MGINWLEIRINNPIAFNEIIKSVCPSGKDSFINFWYVSMDGDLQLCHKSAEGAIVHQHGVTLNELSMSMPEIKEHVKKEIVKLNDKTICNLE